MTYLTLKDGVEIYYKDWGNKAAQPIVFSHGWPLNADNWDQQMFFFVNQGYRVVAHDRRGHGRSSQPWDGNDFDTWAEDLVQVLEHLNVRNAMIVGHSTGGGEVTRVTAKYCGKGARAEGRISKVVLIGSLTPLFIQTEDNPGGVPTATRDAFRAAIEADRSQFFIDVPTGPFFGFNRPGAKVSQGLIQSWWMQGMMCSIRSAHECVRAWETPFADDLKSIELPVLILHGTDDQVVPFEMSAPKAVKLLKNATLKVYQGGPHALHNIETDKVNQDLLEFLKS